MEQTANVRMRKEQFTPEETEVLVWELQARHGIIFGTASWPPCFAEVQTAWTKSLNASVQIGFGSLRTAAPCKRRFNDVRWKQKLSSNMREREGEEKRGER